MVEKESKQKGGDYTLTPQNNTETLLESISKYYSFLMETLNTLIKDIDPFQREWLFEKNWRETKEGGITEYKGIHYRIQEISSSWNQAKKEYLSPDTPEERKREIAYSVEEWFLNYALLNREREKALELDDRGNFDYSKTKVPKYRIIVDRKTGEHRKDYSPTPAWEDKFYIPGMWMEEPEPASKREGSPESRPLIELKKLSELVPLPRISISKDLISSELRSQGDILEIGTEEEKKRIRKIQEKGKLLFGTMEGLSGGNAFFRSVSIALAKILNEQSQYYNPDSKGDKRGGHRLSGIPRNKIVEVFGGSADLEKNINTPKVPINGEERDFPYILLSYERLAKEVSKTGKISGGKDIEGIRTYINGGFREYTTDPKTGNKTPVKSSYVPGLTSKKYGVSDGKGHFIFVPFLVNEGEIVDTTKKDPEVGCLLRLSPQYSKTLRGYTSLRGDTIQLIGGGRQKNITMDILSLLVFNRGTTPEFQKKKRDILSKYENEPTYKGRPGKLESHFREAIDKAKSAKVIYDYKERNSGGEIISVFYYNPDYLKGEDIVEDIQTVEIPFPDSGESVQKSGESVQYPGESVQYSGESVQ